MHQDKNGISNEREHLFKAPQAGLLPIRIYYLKPDFTADIASTGQMANAITKIKEPLWEVISSTFLKHSSHERNSKPLLGSYLEIFPTLFSLNHVLLKNIPIYQT